MKYIWPLFFGITSALVTVPQPEGPYGVSLVNLQLNDTNRTDPYTGKPFRLLPVTLITPTGPASACQPVLTPYMSNVTARYWEKALGEAYGIPLENTLSQLELLLCKPGHPQHQFPLVFFSEGLAFPKELYQILTTNLAAQGFVVVQVSNPGEISFIQFANGQIEYGHTNFSNDSSGTLRAKALDVRVKDISFVLDYLSALREDEMGCSINTTSPSIFGHSFGGPTALATLISDTRFAAGVNEDGAFWGEALTGTTDRPFMILASTPDCTRSLSTVPNWAETWPHLHGPKWLVSVKNTTHNSFVDGLLIAEYFGLNKIPAVRKVLGRIDPGELLRIQVALLSEMAVLISGTMAEKDILNVVARFNSLSVLNSSFAELDGTYMPADKDDLRAGSDNTCAGD